ncbi:MAG TPA: hypothetical protein VNC61_03210 [Acidimicrobiales bacterium]|nr:hypothetical protein [Acidimicrobiales bacterium]
MPNAASSKASRLGALAGPAFAVLFVLSVVVSSPPANNASDATWTANYSGHGHQIQHVATGLLLVLAGLCLMTFLTTLWRRIADRRTEPTSPLALVAAGAASACISAGGVLMATVSASELTGSYSLPGADVLRLTNDVGFGLVAVGGMWATALAVAVLSAQGKTADVIGPRMATFGWVVAVLLVFSLLFLPIIALLIWALVVGVSVFRERNTAEPPVADRIEV